MTSTLLSFSGGLDSLASAILLRSEGYDVTLGHIEWSIEGTDWGQLQTRAATALASELEMPFETLAKVWMPQTSYAKYAWVPFCISTVLHHAGDPCVYPAPTVQRYDSVAFGFDTIDFDGCDVSAKRHWLAGMEGIYDGPVLAPANDLWVNGKIERVIPPHLWDMTVSCYQGPTVRPCGDCFKCKRRSNMS